MATLDVWDVAAQQMVSVPRSAFNPCIFWNDSTTALGASATFTGPSRDCGTAAGTQGVYSSFNAFARSDQAGTVRIEGSANGTVWGALTSDIALAANTPTILTVPVMTRFHRVVVVNGATAQTAFACNSSYTAA